MCVSNVKLQPVWIVSQFVVTVLILNTKPYVLRTDEQNSHPPVHKLLFNLVQLDVITMASRLC